MLIRKRPTTEQVRDSGMTYDAYAAMPDDGRYYEVIEGELELMSPAPTTRHQLVSQALLDAIRDKCEPDVIVLYSPVDVILSRYNVFQPDLVVVKREHAAIISERGVEGPPDVLVEILSPGSFNRDRRKKLPLFATYGVPECWLVDPLNVTLEQYIAVAEGYKLQNIYETDALVQSPTLPCVTFTMRDIAEQVQMKFGGLSPSRG